MTEETKKKISEKLKGRKLTPEWIEKIKKANHDWYYSEEGRKKRSEALKGRHWTNGSMSEEHKKKISESRKKQTRVYFGDGKWKWELKDEYKSTEEAEV